MTCEEVLDQLTAYVDEELDAVESRDLERHVATCAACAAALATERALGESVRASLEYHAAPRALRERLSPRRRPLLAFPPRQAWLAAAAAVVALVGGGWLAAGGWLTMGPFGHSVEGALADDMVSAHVRSLMATHLMDVASTDQHTVKPWFAGKLDFSPAVTDFAADGFPLVGGRLDYVDHRPVAALVYMRRKHVINVFEWPEAGSERPARAVAPRTERGYHVVRADADGLACWFVSDLNADELAGFARRVALAARPQPVGPGYGYPPAQR
jgi:mycothiol system anti-sigma-R factor